MDLTKSLMQANLLELRLLRASHEAMRPVIRQLEQFASLELAREAAPETCRSAQVVVDAWRSVDLLSIVVEVEMAADPAGQSRIESAIAGLGAEHAPDPDWQQDVWIKIAAETAGILVADEIADVIRGGATDEQILEISSRVTAGLLKKLSTK